MDTLYAASGSTSLVAAVLLEECEHPYTLEAMEIYADGAGGTSYAQLNPWRQVPALSTDRGLITEVVAIAEYLDETHPERSLWPRDGWRRVLALRWYSQLSTAIQPYIQCIVRPERFIGERPEGCRLLRAHASALIVARLGLVDAELSQREWLTGDEFGPADALLATMFGWVQLMRLPIAPFDRLREHALRCRARPAFARAIERHGTTPSIVRKTAAEALLGIAAAARTE